MIWKLENGIQKIKQIQKIIIKKKKLNKKENIKSIINIEEKRKINIKIKRINKKE